MGNDRTDILSKRKRVNLYMDQLESAMFLDGDDIKSYLGAIISFLKAETIPEDISPAAAALFHSIKNGLEKANDAYINQSIANQKNGEKGGRPSKPNPNDELGNPFPTEENPVESENNPMGLNGFPNTNTDTDNNITPLTPQGGKPSNRKRFKKPTVDEIAEYCQERNNGIDAAHFWDFYESKGWLVGRSPMKDWKACVRNWEKSNFINAPPDDTPSKFLY